MTKNIFSKKPELLATPGLQTGYKHPKCIASFTSDCSNTLSGEHYFSRSILKMINEEKLNMVGWPWGNSTSLEIGIESLVVNCLCSRHNSSLSPLDDQAARLFKTLLEFDAHILGLVPSPTHYQLFNYLDIERWLIKTLIMTNEASLVRKNGVKMALEPGFKEKYLGILFKKELWEADGVGLYWLYDDLIKTGRSLSFNSNTSTVSGMVEGCTVSLAGFKFVYSSRRLLHIDRKEIHENSHRPWRITLGKDGKAIEKIIDFSPVPKRRTHHTFHAKGH